MITFEIGGHQVTPDNITNAFQAQMLKGLRVEISEKIGSIRDPETGAFPTVVIRGNNLDNLSIHVEGSTELIELVLQRLEIESDQDTIMTATIEEPHVFLSYTSDDADFAEHLAQKLQDAGIDVWWDRWCIRAGDSLRQEIDKGLAECTHFLVLLTPISIDKPWVNQEMDAGLVRKLKDKCRFLPVRRGLSADRLPELLSGMSSPEVTTDEEITQLINDIYNVTRKPPKGELPEIIKQGLDTETGYSAAANAVAQYFVENTEHAQFLDPQIDLEELAKEINLSVEDTEDAIYELSGFVEIRSSTMSNLVQVHSSLFAELDRYWKGWNTADDAIKLAADIFNDTEFPSRPQEIAQRYSWQARRLNPAIQYLLERNLIRDRSGINSGVWILFSIIGTDHLRRFVKSRT